MVSRTLDAVSAHVSKCLQLAVLLEVSAYPKPGNVHRTFDFQETKYEHFLASAVALAPHFAHAADEGTRVLKNGLSVHDINVGEIIKEAVVDVSVWQHGGNTSLGSIILLVPIAASAGLALGHGSFSIKTLRSNLRRVVEGVSTDDALNLYDAIALAQPGGLGRSPQLDVTEARSKQEIKKKHISLFDVFKISAPWDSISKEWVTNYHITFDIGYPFFHRLIETEDVNTTTVHTYLKILSESPDTLITRKASEKESKWVSSQAKKTLEAGGLTTSKGRRSLLELDRKLHDRAHRWNPGTTADLTSAVLAVAVLNGYRP